MAGNTNHQQSQPNAIVPIVNDDGTPSATFFQFLVTVFSVLNLTGLFAVAKQSPDIVPVTPGASPFQYLAPTSGVLFVDGAPGMTISVSRNGGAFVNTGAQTGPIPLADNDLARIIYTQPPSLHWGAKL